MNGSGMPVTGIMPIVMPTFTKAWKRKMVATPTARSTPKRSREMVAMWSIRQTRMKNSTSSVRLPTNPTLSARLENMKSVCSAGR